MWERPAALLDKRINTLQLEEFPSLLGHYAFSPAKVLPTSRLKNLSRFSGSSTFCIASHWRQNQYAFPKHRYTFTGRQSVFSKKTNIYRNAAARISNTVSQNYIYAKNKWRLNSGNASYHLINFLSLSLSLAFSLSVCLSVCYLTCCFVLAWNLVSRIHGGTRRGEFRPRQTMQLPRTVDLKGRLLSCQSY